MSLKDLKSVSTSATLSELGMDSLMAVEIKQTLEREFEVFLSPQDLRSLTFLKLQELEAQQEAALVNAGAAPEAEKPVIMLGKSKDMGEAMLFRSFGDEENCFETILRLQSKDDNNNYHTAALIIPGVEGVAGDVYRQLSTSLNASTFILQLTNARNKANIHDIAQTVFKVGNYSLPSLAWSLWNLQFQEVLSFSLQNYSSVHPGNSKLSVRQFFTCTFRNITNSTFHNSASTSKNLLSVAFITPTTSSPMLQQS